MNSPYHRGTTPLHWLVPPLFYRPHEKRESLRQYRFPEISKFINKKDEIKTKSFYIQINIGSEDQKSGIDKSEFKDFYHYALAKDLNIEGLMCIPPNDTNTNEYFREMNDIRKKINPTLKLSMGMSNDYQIALEHQSNLIRIGSLIFND